MTSQADTSQLAITPLPQEHSEEHGTVSFTDSAYYKPSSSPVRTLVVQQDMVASWPLSALPTDYWTRPVHVENREWWTISGNWPGTGYQGGGSIWDQLYPDTSPTWNAQHKFTPWVQGPNSGHILWKEQGNLAGIIGGQAGQYGYTGAPPAPSIIYAGRCYQSTTKVNTTLPTTTANILAMLRPSNRKTLLGKTVSNR